MASLLKSHLIKGSGIVVACVLAVAIQVIYLSPISPAVLESPPFSAPSNSKLQDVVKLGEGYLNQPEDVAIDKNGVLYTATRDGCVKILHKNGTWSILWQTERDSLLGLTTTTAGDIIVCDAEKGLLKIEVEGSMTVLASHVNGSRIRFADDVVESEDGTLYFSVLSTKFGFHNWQLEVLEAKPHGQLLKYDPLLNDTSIVLDNLACANGVALSADQDYLVVCETWKFRCLKYWLKGELKGQTEIFVDNLPGGPDNINLAPDGSFWIALVELVPNWLRFVHTSLASKYVIAAVPGLSKWVISGRGRATVVNVASDGNVVQRYDDPTGKVMAFVTSALEFEHNLYLGSLHCNFVGKFALMNDNNTLA